jgi:hypothetical protein
MNRYFLRTSIGTSIGTSIAIIGSVMLASPQAQAQSNPLASCLSPTGRPLYSQSPYGNGLQTRLAVADFRTTGDCLLTRDTQTGLEWLDLNATVNRSYDDVAAGFGGYTTAGFRFATRSEVDQLFVNAIATVVDSEGSPIGQRALLPETLGATFASSGPGAVLFGSGLFGSPDASGRLGLASYEALANSLATVVTTTGGDQSRSATNAYAGSFLVRTTKGEVTAVPTPALLPGLLGMAAAVRKRRKAGQNG